MAIDWDKPVQTRDGRPVRILCRDRKGLRPVHGLVSQSRIDKEVSSSWYENGQIRKNGESYADLVNVPVRREVWVNFYQRHNHIEPGPDTYESKADADMRMRHSLPRIACVKVEFEEGEGL